MLRRFDIPWVGVGQIIMGRAVKIPWVEVQYIMDIGFKIPWVGGLIYHG
jgi:hypothetical protein